MQLVQVFRMNGGVGESSYANNSSVPKKMICMTKSIKDEAITKLYRSQFLPKITMVDLGCSSGPNTLLVVAQLITKVAEICRTSGSKLPEFQVFLNDLPGNDFNTLFKSLPKFQEELGETLGLEAGQCCFGGVPGSFYGRLFPTKCLHFVHSSCCLHWLSQVPRGLENNEGNICVTTTSPSSVLNAYYQQFQRDFSMFLKCRSQEMVEGGSMVLSLLGRENDNILRNNSTCIFELLGVALNQLVSEGLIEEEKINSFNIPSYLPSSVEVKSEILKEGSFALDLLELSEVNWIVDDQMKTNNDVSNNRGYTVAKYMRTVVESLLVNHFGEAVIDEVFNRYGAIITERMSKEKTGFTNVIVSLTKVIE